MPQKVLIILGMHRSGTSALSGALNIKGVDFGSSVVSLSFDNPRGFYENYRIQDLNDELLNSLGRSWDTPGLLPEAWWELPNFKKFETKAKGIINSEFGKSDLFAIKDPRMCLLFPFWENILRTFNCQVSCIILIRHPKEIAASLEKRNFFNTAKSHLLTSSYLLSAEYYTRQVDRVVLSYDSLLENPVSIMSHIQNQLNLTFPQFHEESEQIVSYLSPNLRTHRVTNQENNPIDKALLSLQVYEVMYKALNLKGIDLQLQSELDKYRITLRSYNSNALKELIGHQNYFAKLLIASGEGFTEKDAIIRKIYGRKNEWHFSLKEKGQPIRALKFIPANTPCSLRIHKIDVNFENDRVKYVISENSFSRKGEVLFFDNEFPQIIIDFDKATSISEFIVEVDYLEIGKLDEITNLKLNKGHSDTPGWLQIILSAAKHPVSLIQNINLKNLRTLRSALKREDPRQIIRNFKKLLKRKESQEIIEAQSIEGKKEFLDKNRANNITQPGKSKDHRSQLNQITRNSNSLHLLYVVPFLPDYDSSSGGKRATRLLSLLTREFHVNVYSIGPNKEKYINHLESLGIRVIDGPQQSIIKKLPRVDVIIYAWYYTFNEAKKIVKLYPAARTIIDTVDIHWVREERSIGIWEDITPERVAINKKKEIEVYNNVDVIWAVSESDRQAVLHELPQSDVRIVSNIHFFEERSYKDPQTNILLFVGGFNHYPNVSAVQLLATQIFPKVLEEIPSAQLIIVGSNASEEVARLGNLPNVTFMGFVEEQELRDLYHQAFLCVAPLLTGAGIKGKITEAIEYMIPIVTNSIGNEGIDLLHLKSGLITKDNSDMVKIIIKALRRNFDFGKMTFEARKKLKNLVAPDHNLNAMKSSFYRPVDICIVTWNNVALLKMCIESIFEFTDYPNFNVLVYSNGCTDGTQEYLNELSIRYENLSSILSSKNDVYVIPNNIMMRANKNHDIILLNNDAVVTEGWLKGLSRSAYYNEHIGIVGPKILYPDGSLQEFGSEIFIDGSGINIGKGDDPSRPEYSAIKAINYVSGCCMYIKRSTIEKVGFLDEIFHPCYFEDSDYCYRAWTIGLFTVVTPEITIYHQEGATSGVNENDGFKRYQKTNRLKFLERHKVHIALVKKKIVKLNKSTFFDNV